MSNIIATKIILFVILGLLVIIGVLQLCKPSETYADVDTDISNDTFPCGIHDSSYVEPTLKNGIFVSDSKQLSFVVKDNTIQLMGDKSALREILFKKFNGHITSGNGEDLTEEAVLSELTLWKNPQEYTVSTAHGITVKTPNNSDVEGVFIVVPFEYSISNNLSIAIIDDNTLEYMDTYFYRVVSDDLNVGHCLDISDTDVFSAEAYLLPVNAANDEYIIDCTITNLTSDELSVDMSHYISLCYKSKIVSPTAYGTLEEYTFSPNESRNFVFNVKNNLVDGYNDTKEISGSYVLEITNNEKNEYEHYHELKIKPYIIERQGGLHYSSYLVGIYMILCFLILSGR